MDPLNSLPKVSDFLMFADLRTGAVMIAAFSMVHIFFYGCTFFMKLTYQLVTTWILVSFFSVFSVLLILGIQWEDTTLLSIWIWYALVFVVAMFLLMFLFVIVFITRKDMTKLFIVFFAISWYLLNVYFIFVVNSYRMELSTTADSKTGNDDDISSSSDPSPTNNTDKGAESVEPDTTIANVVAENTIPTDVTVTDVTDPEPEPSPLDKSMLRNDNKTARLRLDFNVNINKIAGRVADKKYKGARRRDETSEYDKDNRELNQDELARQQFDMKSKPLTVATTRLEDPTQKTSKTTRVYFEPVRAETYVDIVEN